MKIEKHYHEILHLLEGVLLYIFEGLAERCKEEVSIAREICPSEVFIHLTFAERQKLLREEGPPEFINVRDGEDISVMRTSMCWMSSPFRLTPFTLWLIPKTPMLAMLTIS